MGNKFLKPEVSRVLREEMGYVNRAATCKTCAHQKEIEDPQVDRSWIQTCALFESFGLITIDVAGVCKHHKEQTSPCG